MNSAQSLSPGTLLHGTYRIERTLGQGGYGITYLATDEALETQVAIKEFFPKTLCSREGSTSHLTVASESAEEMVGKLRAKFLKEARNIAKFSEPDIIRIYAAFEANNTAYYVMEYVDGESLAQKVAREGALPEARAVGYIRQIAKALSFVHNRHLNHLDVKPANVMVRQSTDRIVLIDFGLSKRYDEDGQQTSTTPVGLSHGYAPIEQYKQGGVSSFSPETDIYSLGATLYALLTGLTPPDAIEVAESGITALPLTISESTRLAVSRAMSFSKADRPHSIEEFVALLDDPIDDEDTVIVVDDPITPSSPTPPSTPISPVTPSTPSIPTPPAPPTPPTPPTPSKPSSNKKALWVILSVVSVLLIASSVFLLLRKCNTFAEEYIPDDTLYPDSAAILDSIYYNSLDAAGVVVEEEVADSAAYVSEQVSTPAAGGASASATASATVADGKLVKPSAVSPLSQCERTLRDLLYFPLGVLPETVITKEGVRKALTNAFGSAETINAFSVGLHRNARFSYTYLGEPIEIAYSEMDSPRRSWFRFYFKSYDAAERFVEAVGADMKANGIPVTKDKIYGGYSNRNKPVGIFKWVGVDQPTKVKEADNCNLNRADMVGKFVVEINVYLK